MFKGEISVWGRSSVTDIRIVYVFVLSYTPYFHIVEVKYGWFQNKTRYSHRITMHVVTSVNTGTVTNVTYTDGTNTLYLGANYECTGSTISGTRCTRQYKDPVLIPVHKLYLMTYVPSTLLRSSFGCIFILKVFVLSVSRWTVT